MQVLVIKHHLFVLKNISIWNATGKTGSKSHQIKSIINNDNDNDIFSKLSEVHIMQFSFKGNGTSIIWFTRDLTVFVNWLIDPHLTDVFVVRLATSSGISCSFWVSRTLNWLSDPHVTDVFGVRLASSSDISCSFWILETMIFLSNYGNEKTRNHKQVSQRTAFHEFSTHSFTWKNTHIISQLVLIKATAWQKYVW